MEVLKCKMCGGELELTENASICKCKFCGSMQTLPREKSDIRVNAYNMANHLFRNNDYDKAMTIYEKILLEDPEDANAYWSSILCKYGVNYVEDPVTGERKITVNRTQNEPVETDELYKSAMEYATDEQKELFEKDAKTIDEIQRGILDISRNEKPFDIFISYKETDANGHRTPDSELATQLYYGLTDAGYKVFLSRITLEDKLGREYEPYIYAALNSAKVMIVLGTKTEYFNAPWVKNEWSRYLKIIKKDRSKLLIPAYRDIDPYDLPPEFALLQSQNMANIGFLQDIIRGVKKVIVKKKEEPKKSAVDNEMKAMLERLVKDKEAAQGAVSGDKTAQRAPVSATSSDEVQNLIQRIKIFIDGKDWASAGQYIERALDKAPLNPELYALKAQVNNQLNNLEDLENSGLMSEPNLNNAIKFADGDYKVRLENIRDNMKDNTRRAKEQAEMRARELAEQKRIKAEKDRLARERRQAHEAALTKIKNQIESVETNIRKAVDSQSHDEYDIAAQCRRTSKSNKLNTAFVLSIISRLLMIFGIVTLLNFFGKEHSDGSEYVAVIPMSIVPFFIVEIVSKCFYKSYDDDGLDFITVICLFFGEYFSLTLYGIYLDIRIIKSKIKMSSSMRKGKFAERVMNKIKKGETVTKEELDKASLNRYYNNTLKLPALRKERDELKAKYDAMLAKEN